MKRFLMNVLSVWLTAQLLVSLLCAFIFLMQDLFRDTNNVSELYISVGVAAFTMAALMWLHTKKLQ